MPRHQRILSETGTYHVMMRGNERKDLFVDEEDKQRFVETLGFKKKETGFALYAYCLMDNHVHLVVTEAQEGLANMMKRINGSYALYFNKKNQRIGHLFQDRFKSEPIEDERYLLAAIRYVHNNPVKAGMVETAAQYKWSSIGYYLIPDRQESMFVDTGLVLSMISENRLAAIEEFKRFSFEGDEGNFLDFEEGNELTFNEGLLCLEEYVQKWPGAKLDELLSNPVSRNEIIAYLRGNTTLSVRKIAELLGVTRGIVQKVSPLR